MMSLYVSNLYKGHTVHSVRSFIFIHILDFYSYFVLVPIH